MTTKHLTPCVRRFSAWLFCSASSELATWTRTPIPNSLHLAVKISRSWAQRAQDRDIFTAKCNELGIGVLVQVANSDDALQNNQAENLLTQGVKCLVVIPHNGK